MKKISKRQKIAAMFVWLAQKIYQGKIGYTYLKPLFGGWIIMDGCLVKQSTCKVKGLKNAFQWESWSTPTGQGPYIGASAAIRG